MSRQQHTLRLARLTFVLAVALEACSTPVAPRATVASSTSGAQPVPSIGASVMPTLPLPARTALPAPTSATPAISRITITATGGNLFIRRGPDLAFNPVGSLLQGQSASALARDVLSEWVEVPLPGKPDQTGWISVQTKFTTISGDLASLPELQIDYWPVGASIRNCTLHQMLITPGNIVLPSLVNFPANDVRVNPGVYVVVDTDVDGYPQVLKVEISEGSAVDVRVDGNGDRKKCPVP